MMHIEVLPPLKNSHTFDVVYFERELSIGSVMFHGGPPFSYTSIVFNYIQLEVSETGIVDHVWGCCPKSSWCSIDLKPPKGIPGRMRIIPESKLLPGVSIQMSEEKFPQYFDKQNRWLCIGDPQAIGEFQIQIEPSLIIVATSLQIITLWIRIDRFEQGEIC